MICMVPFVALLLVWVDVCVDNGERQHNIGWKCIACKAFNIAGGLSCESCNLLCLICKCLMLYAVGI